MKTKDISFIIPVYNRPDEVKERLDSFLKLDGDKDFEIDIIEDGSQISSKDVVTQNDKTLRVSYFYKPNSDSRNFGMLNARGNYFIILDSDCILPKRLAECQ